MTARQATSAIEAENNEGLDKATVLCCKELLWINFLPYHIYSCVGFCKTLNKRGNWEDEKKL